jgi:hypothetical protein
MGKLFFNAEQKNMILTLYRHHDRSSSFSALARRFCIKGGKGTVQRWHRRWNHDAASLLRKKGAGRPRILSKPQVTRYVRQPIQRSNRKHEPIHYSTLLPRVIDNSGKNLSLRTLQRYGKEDAHCRAKRTHIITVNECKYMIHAST